MRYYLIISFTLCFIILSSFDYTSAAGNGCFFKEPSVVKNLGENRRLNHSLLPGSDDVQIFASCDQYSPQLACLSTGELFSAFYTSDSIIFVMSSTDGGESWYPYFFILWGERGASISEINLIITEGDSLCIFLPHIVYYSGVDISQLILYRINLNTGTSGFQFIKEYGSPVIPTSPNVISDAWDSSNYRVRVTWLVKGATADTICYINSLDKGFTWSDPIVAYVNEMGGISNLSTAYGNGEWWMAWDKSGDIFVRNLFSGNPVNITHNPNDHYRPVIAVSSSNNSSGKTSIVVAFVRRWSQSDLGAYFVASRNSGQNWSPIYVIGTDLMSSLDFNPYVSYSKTLNRFYFTYITQDSIGLSSQYYTISSYYATNDIPDQLVSINKQVNDNTFFGSNKANPVILGNPSRGGEPMLVWRHWGGSGEGKIMFDAQYRLPSVMDEIVETPINFKLYSPYPNPFNPTTKISYTLPIQSNVIIMVTDILGKEVTKLIDEVKLPGHHEFEWYAGRVSSGVYFCRIIVTNKNMKLFEDSKKLLIIK